MGGLAPTKPSSLVEVGSEGLATRTFAELLIDCKEDRAILVGTLRKPTDDNRKISVGNDDQCDDGHALEAAAHPNATASRTVADLTDLSEEVL